MANGIRTNGSLNPLVGVSPKPSQEVHSSCDSGTIALADSSMPIAIIGIGCRFPGDATSPDKFWKFISEGRSARSEIPNDRFNIEAFYHPAGERQGTVSNEIRRSYI